MPQGLLVPLKSEHCCHQRIRTHRYIDAMPAADPSCLPGSPTAPLSSAPSHTFRESWMPQYSYLLCFVLFLMWAIFKDFLEFDTILLPLYVLVFGCHVDLGHSDHGSKPHPLLEGEVLTTEPPAGSLISPVRPGLAPLWRFSWTSRCSGSFTPSCPVQMSRFCEVVLTRDTPFKYLPTDTVQHYTCSHFTRLEVTLSMSFFSQLMTYSTWG